MNLNFCVLCALVCFGVSEAMRVGDEGVCEVMMPFPKTKTVQEIYPCGKGKKCTRLSQKKYKDLVLDAACCDGFIWEEKTDICEPFCQHGCKGGKCVKPNTCQCEPPLILVNNKCTPPVCNPPCVNGNCTAPNTCTCNEGYQLKDDNYTCGAQCTDCENGECRTPNVCECNEGYSKIENKCKPVCKSACNNGYCAAPDVCSCNEGYESKNNTCLPICGKACVNANCVAPNTCECITGFERKGASKEVCKPKCDSCLNGECVGPNRCRCHEGYALVDKVCRPTCDNTCVNGTCVAPNTCECLTGFERTSKKDVCRPKCDACINGDCIAPKKCICRKGYALKNNICVHTCEDECVNANCVAPNTCECFDGFEHKIGHEAVCMPKCDSCANGECVSPNKCVCHIGYNLTDNGCKPICKDACVNGNCTAPDKCTCNDDLKLVNGNCESLAGNASGRESSTTGLASLEMSWVVGGAVGVLLIVLAIVVIQRMWRRREDYGPKIADNGTKYGSVIYTLPDTLIKKNEELPRNDAIDEANETEEEGTSEKLMSQSDGIV